MNAPDRTRPSQRRRQVTRARVLPSSGATVTYRNGHTALRDVSFRDPDAAPSRRWSASTAAASRPCSRRSWALSRSRRGSISILGRSVAQALKSNLVAYVPQSEDVDWNFPVLVEDVVMMGRYGHMNLLRLPRRRTTRRWTRRLPASA